MEENEKVVDVEVKDAPNENLSSPKSNAPVREAWSKYETFAIISLVLGITAIELASFCWYPIGGIVFTIAGLVLGIVGLVFGVKVKKDGRKRMRTLKNIDYIVSLISVIVSAIAVVVSIVVTILVIQGIAQDIGRGINSALTNSTTSALLSLL